MPPGPPMPPGGPGWGPPGPPRRPNNNAAVIIVLAVFVVLIGGGGLLWLASDDGDSGGSSPVSAPTLPDISAPPGYTPPPSYSPPALPSSAPYSPPDTYSPPPRYYGAIAVGRDGSVGKAWDYGSTASARRRALNECPRSSCRVLVVFVNSCGAIAYNPGTNKYWGGRGATRTAAERDAISNAGGGHWITWVCTTR
jgi:uncharacterized protein DUF4189